MTPSKQYWLIKSEPYVYSIDDLQKDKKTHWHGVRNYQARNYMRDGMQAGDMVLFYYSNTDPNGIAGTAAVAKAAYPDTSAVDPESEYYDPKATPKNPIWFMVDVIFIEKFSRVISLEELKAAKPLQGMMLIEKGRRPSVQPVSEKHFKAILEMAKKT
jgi:predicted RNA-binding protein with PUA-like domain